MDESPENFRTAFAPPPRPFFGKFHCDFFRKFITKITVSNAKKIAMKFFGSEMTPPPFGNFPEIHSNPGTQASLRLRVFSYQLFMVQFILSHVDASIKYVYTLKSPISFTHLKTNTHSVFYPTKLMRQTRIICVQPDLVGVLILLCNCESVLDFGYPLRLKACK